jgi:cell surface protein SprA
VSSKIFERTRNETTAYDVLLNVNVDKLIPGNTGIKIPMSLGYQRETIKPLYDPANPDTKLNDVLQTIDNEEDRTNYLKIVQDQATTRSINFINVRKMKVNPESKTHLWDVENLAFSYSYSDRIHTNFNTAQELQKSHRGSVAYTFSPKGTGVEPFKDFKSLSSPWLKVIKDFNFNLMPNTISVRFDLERSFSKNVYRNSAGNGTFVNSDPNYMKYFTFNRNYNVKWNLSKNLSLEYNSKAYAVIDEPLGEIDSKEKRDSVLTNLKNFGRMKNFDQSITINYTLPFDKIPATDWIGADYRYQASYSWKAGPVNKPDPVDSLKDPNSDDLDDDYDFKNTIQNSRDQSYTGKLDLVKLYNKVKVLKALNTPKKPVNTKTPQRQPQRPTKADTVKTSEPLPGIARLFFRTLMSIRSINGTYTFTEGTVLPGFIEKPALFGMSKNWSAPGLSFVLGSQDPNIRHRAAANEWLAHKTDLTLPFQQTRNQTINLRANIEPSPDFKIQVDFRKEKTSMYQEIFRDSANTGFQSRNPNRSGSYRVSIVSIMTAFNTSNDKVNSSVFHDFEQNLEIIRGRIQIANPANAEYDLTTQDVIIPAFIAAYTGKDANAVSLSPFPNMPMPNWRVDYTGLNKSNFFNQIFQSITLSTGYQSSYSVMNYSNSLTAGVDVRDIEINHPIESYNSTFFGTKGTDDKVNPGFVISQVLISEQFAPLIGVNVRTKGRLTANFQYKTKRDLSLNISNAQITELNSKDVSFELGYTKNNMRLPIKQEGRTVVLKNDVTFRLNMTVSDNKTIQRKIAELNMITNGNINFQLRPNISYVVNQKLNIQIYFERTINAPQVSTAYRRATTKFGTQIRFSLAQ